MKKRLWTAALMGATVAALFAAAAVACGDSNTDNKTKPKPTPPSPHTHTYSDAWESNASGHWHKADCGHEVTSEVVMHDYRGGVCAVCNYAVLDAFEYESIEGGQRITGLKDKTVTGVSIPNSVVEIADDVFKDVWLERVDIWDINAWLRIDFDNADANPLWRADALYVNNSPVIDLVIPDGVTKIKNNAFYGYDLLNSVKLSSTVETVGSNAFYDCNGIVRLELGSGLTEVGLGAFMGNRRLVEIHDLSSGSSDFSELSFYKNALRVYSDNSASAVKAMDGGYTFFSEGTDKCLVKYDGAETEVVLPSSFDGGTYTVRNHAFYNNTNITLLDVGDGVTAIGDGAFYGNTELKTVKVGVNVAEIADNAFMYCAAINTVYNNSSLDIVKGESTHGGIAENANFVFTGGELDGYDYTTVFGDYSFAVKDGVYYLTRYNGAETEIVLPASINGHDYEIGDAAFYSTASKLEKITISDGVTAIGAQAFYEQDALTLVTLGNKVKTVGAYAFYGTGITDITIPDSMRYIDGLAFYGVEFGNDMQYEYSGNVWYIGSSANPYLLAFIAKVPDDGAAIVLHEKTKAIAATMFYNCTADVVISDGVETIATYAFYGYKGKALTIGKNVKRVDSDAFRSCYAIERVNVESLTVWLNIDYADQACNPLACKDTCELYVNGEKLSENLVIDSGVTAIKPHAFYNCSQLKSVDIGGTVTEIGKNAFGCCGGLRSVTVRGSVNTIGEKAFVAGVGTSVLSSLTIEEGVERIENNAFTSHNKLLTQVIIPSTVSYIGTQAFYGCDSLVNAEFKSTSGWQRSAKADFSGEVESVAAVDLADQSKAATLLRQYNRYWKRV